MNPRYTFTPVIVRDLMEVEAARQTVQLTVLSPQVAEQLRQQARVRSTHYSTRIEGNRLTLVEARQAVLDGQNVIRDSVTGDIIYLPPEAADVPSLMRDLVAWVEQAEHEGLPCR
jgi:Fic family protein